jgi:hypothetical protein
MIRNIFACLVHENQECVFDLVRNLHCLDPSSTILLYNGAPMPDLLGGGFPFDEYGAVVHPFPRPMSWGRLHDFALDCMAFAAENLPFDTLTIVDSDQLGTRPGYSEFLGRALERRTGVGLLSSAAAVLPSSCQIGPVLAAFQEIDLWLPLLRRFPDGERKFAHWSFWPSTVFTADAARDLTRLFATDGELQQIMSRTRIWATEEVILPTLTALLGYEIAAHPCSYDFVKYRVTFTPGHIEAALGREDVFWLHPIPRQYDDPLRSQVRRAVQGYQPVPAAVDPQVPELTTKRGLLLSLPILQRMKGIEGWFEEDEGDLLIAATGRAIDSLPAGAAVVEVGSFCGRSTVVLGSVVKSLGAQAIVYAIDPHDGRVGATDQGVQTCRPTLDIFLRNIADNALSRVVESIPKYSTEVEWDKPIALLLIDGLHDYGNVARDFHHFESWILPGGYVAFHDYADYYPGVKAFVDELLASGHFEKLHCIRSLMVLRKQFDEPHQASPDVRAAEPLVSCIMPTADRRSFVPRAISQFLRQDYPNRELIVIDDGIDSIEDLIPTDDRIRYVRLSQKLSIGAKHNMGCELARGEVILHWDDDDWHSPWRVSYQVRDLLKNPAASLCGLSRLFFYEPGTGRAWEYVYPAGSRPWVSGATFCYHKSFWEQHRFPDMNEGGDTVFVWDLRDAHIVAHADQSFYLATVHPNNTSPKRTSDPAWQPRPVSDIRRMLDDEAWSFYERLGSGMTAAHVETST